MDRRKVLKKIGYGSGAIIVSPQILNMLNSCQSSENKNLPIFFTKIQSQIISKIMVFLLLLVFKVSTANQDLIQLVEVVQMLQQLCLLNF